MKLAREMTLEEARAVVREKRREHHRLLNELEDAEDALRAWSKWAWERCTREQKEELFDLGLVDRGFIRREGR